MENTTSVEPNDKDQEEKTSKDPNVEEGKKMIEIQKKVGASSEEESKEDADKWRNEG